MQKKYLEAGKFVTTHGVMGELKAYKGMALLKLEGIDGMDAARALVNRVFYIDRDDAHLPEGSWFLQDIIGLQVLDADTGKEYGTVVDITNSGASDIYEIRTPDGKTVLFPAVKEFLAEISPEQGYVRVRPIGGMFEDAD